MDLDLQLSTRRQTERAPARHGGSRTGIRLNAQLSRISSSARFTAIIDERGPGAGVPKDTTHCNRTNLFLRIISGILLA